MNWRILIRGAAVAAVPLLIGAAPLEDRFQTRLSPVAMDLLTRDDVAGLGQATAILSGDRLKLEGSYRGLPSVATGAELRQGIVVGARGPAVLQAMVSGERQGTIAATARLSREQVQALRSGRLYVQVRSERAPDGNLWGWLLPVSGLPKLK